MSRIEILYVRSSSCVGKEFGIPLRIVELERGGDLFPKIPLQGPIPILLSGLENILHVRYQKEENSAPVIVCLSVLLCLSLPEKSFSCRSSQGCARESGTISFGRRRRSQDYFLA